MYLPNYKKPLTKPLKKYTPKQIKTLIKNFNISNPDWKKFPLNPFTINPDDVGAKLIPKPLSMQTQWLIDKGKNVKNPSARFRTRGWQDPNPPLRKPLT